MTRSNFMRGVQVFDVISMTQNKREDTNNRDYKVFLLDSGERVSVEFGSFFTWKRWNWWASLTLVFAPACMTHHPRLDRNSLSCAPLHGQTCRPDLKLNHWRYGPAFTHFTHFLVFILRGATIFFSPHTTVASHNGTSVASKVFIPERIVWNWFNTVYPVLPH